MIRETRGPRASSKRLQTFFATIFVSGLLALGCTMVPADTESENVAVVGADEVADCKKISQTTVSVLSKMGILKRRSEQVAAELETLAKNEAAKKGGGFVVPIGEPEAGEQSFEIYDCPAGH
jgi:hypothetical protein